MFSVCRNKKENLLLSYNDSKFGYCPQIIKYIYSIFKLHATDSEEKMSIFERTSGHFKSTQKMFDYFITYVSLMDGLFNLDYSFNVI